MKCPFCNVEMPPHLNQILSTYLKDDVLITTVRHSWYCKSCRVNIDRVIETDTVIP